MARKYKGGGYKPPQREPEHKCTLSAHVGKVKRKMVAAARPPRPDHTTFCTHEPCGDSFTTEHLPRARDCPPGWRCLGGRKRSGFRCSLHPIKYNTLNPSVPAYGGRCKCGNGTVWKHVQPAGWVVLEGGGLRCPLCEEVHQILMRRRAARHKARRATRAASVHTQEA